MTRGVQLVRLLTAVAIACAACWFVVYYDTMAYIRYRFDHPSADGHRESPDDAFSTFVLASRPNAAAFVTSHRSHAWIVPLAGLLAGILIIWRWPTRQVLIELVAGSLWVLAFLWAGFVLIVWQMQNVSIFHGGRWHY